MKLNISALSGMMNHHEKKEKDTKNNSTKNNIIGKDSGKNAAMKSGGKNENNNSNYTGQKKTSSNIKNTSQNPPSNYVGAPYNFIPIAKETYDYTKQKKQRPVHNDMNQELLSGYIDYTVEAKTPIMVDGGLKNHNETPLGKFYRDAYGRYAIPGSSMRGLVRSNAQILSISDISDDIEDYKLMYREVANGALQKYYSKINVQAGYIVKEKGEYQIFRTCVDEIDHSCGKMNYYVASERSILKEYQSNPVKSKYQYLYSSEFGHLMQYTKDCEFEEEVRAGQKHYTPKNEKKMFNGRQNGGYHPFYARVSYENKERHITAIGVPQQFSKAGYILSSGAMREKKAIYIIPEIDRTKDPIPVSKELIDAYKIDLKGKETIIKENLEFFSLPEEGEEKPVFFIELEKRLYFGFTPHLRLFYDNSIKKGLKQKKTKIDYCKAMFGTASKEDRYKTRISFQDAYMKERKEEIIEMPSAYRILSSPKPTSYLDYLENDRKEKEPATYNSNFKLRGIKQYWLKEDVFPKDAGEFKNKNVGSEFHPLKAGSVFIGKVHFHNLTEDELGLLIWSLELNKESEQNIGKAKPYGYGRVKVTVDKVAIFQLDQAYDLEQFLFKPWKTVNKDPYVQSFKNVIQKWKGREIETIPSIREFLLMKDSTKIPVSENTRYMSIDTKEYQKRKTTMLPKIDEIIKK